SKKRRATKPKVRLGLPDLDQSKEAVIGSLRSPESQRGYRVLRGDLPNVLSFRQTSQVSPRHLRSMRTSANFLCKKSCVISPVRKPFDISASEQKLTEKFLTQRSSKPQSCPPDPSIRAFSDPILSRLNIRLQQVNA